MSLALFLLFLTGTIISSPFLLRFSTFKHLPFARAMFYSLLYAIPFCTEAVITGVTSLIYLALLDPLRMLYHGICNGLNKPIHAFFEDFWEAWATSPKNSYLQLWADCMDEWDQTKERENILFTSLQSKTSPKGGSLLTKREIEPISAQFLHINHRPHGKKMLMRLGQYTELQERLDTLDSALEQRIKMNACSYTGILRSCFVKQEALQNFEDECIPYNDIVEPIVLQKEYKKTTNQSWKVVPQSTFITDKSSMERWMDYGYEPTHPIIHDFLSQPGAYKGYKTRYRWYTYQSLSQELVERAEKIQRHSNTYQENTRIEL